MTRDAETASLLARAGVPGALDRLVELTIIKDGLIGWGLPEPFDAYSDGTTNPEDTIYAYTTALAGLAFLEAGEPLWSGYAADTLCSLTAPSGLIWYSDQAADQQDGYEVPNVSGVALAFLAQVTGGSHPLAMALLHWQGRDLAANHPDYHPANWRYRTGLPQPTDLFHETLIAHGLREAGETEAAQRSIGGMWATHFDNHHRPFVRHTQPGRASWGPPAMAWLTGDARLLEWLDDNEPDGEGRDGEVARAWWALALSTHSVEVAT